MIPARVSGRTIWPADALTLNNAGHEYRKLAGDCLSRIRQLIFLEPSMYLADALLRSTSSDPNLSQMRSRLEDAELFAVEASAMTLCHELRLESAGQLERISGIICAHPRTIFAETSTKVLAPLLMRVMHMDEPLALQLIKTFPRIGVLMVPDGNEVELTLAWINGEIPHRKWSADWRTRLVGVGTWHVRLSTSEPFPFQSPDVMLAAAFHRPEVDVFIRAFEQDGIPYDDAVHMAWMTNRLLALGGTPDQDAHGWDGVLRTVAIAAAIALGAILQVEAPELKRDQRSAANPRSRRPARTMKAVYEDRPFEDRLSIVTLRLTDPEMQRWYETPAQAERRKRKTAARHLVRGHLFATRWGGIAWRKPHWRGDPNRKTLHRVI